MFPTKRNRYFCEEYVFMASFNGKAFIIDASNVDKFVVNFTSGNEMDESKIQSYEAQNNGNLDRITNKLALQRS